MWLSKIIIAVLIIFVLISYQYGKKTADLCNLRGFYESSSEFNDESGIKAFTMYVGDYNGNTYDTYVLMVDNDENILANAPSPMTLSQIWNPFSKECYEFGATFDLKSDFLPNKMNMKFYPKSGKILLFDSKTVYGCLFKNPVLTEMDMINDELKKSAKQNIKQTSKKPNKETNKSENDSNDSEH